MSKLSRIHLSALEYPSTPFNQLKADSYGSKEVHEDITSFEEECAKYLQTSRPILALSSATAAIHLALILAGIKKGDHVLCQSMTFVASVNPLLYIGAIPVFVDSEPQSWNMDPSFLKIAYQDLMAQGIAPKAVILTSIYGMPYKVDEISAFAKANQLTIIEDSAEALGSSYNQQSSGTLGDYGIISFNNNKIISTAGGGILICPDKETYDKGKYLATQAKEDRPYYHHKTIGFNYRMGHLNALLGLAQLPLLNKRVEIRRCNNAFYQKALNKHLGISFHKIPSPKFVSNFWLSSILVNPYKSNGITRDDLLVALEAKNIESRPLWKPMHLQPLYEQYPYYGGTVCEELFEHGLCLPSGSNLKSEDKERIAKVIECLFTTT